MSGYGKPSVPEGDVSASQSGCVLSCSRIAL
jgi:hypothetical protein